MQFQFVSYFGSKKICITRHFKCTLNTHSILRNIQMIYYANIQTHIVMNHSQIVTNRIFEGNLYVYHFCYIFPSATQVVHVTVLF